MKRRMILDPQQDYYTIPCTLEDFVTIASNVEEKITNTTTLEEFTIDHKDDEVTW